MTCFREEGLQGLGQGGEQGQGNLLASAVFSDSFRLKYSVCQGATFGGSML